MVLQVFVINSKKVPYFKQLLLVAYDDTSLFNVNELKSVAIYLYYLIATSL